MPLSVVVAVVAALAILLIAVGIAASGPGSGINSRLERYAAGKEKEKILAQPNQTLGEKVSQSAALARLNRVVEGRDFGANLARELSAADLRLKVSEYLGIWASGLA